MISLLYIFLFVVADLLISLSHIGQIKLSKTLKLGFLCLYGIVFIFHIGLIPFNNLLPFSFFLINTILLVFLHFAMLIAKRSLANLAAADSLTEEGKQHTRKVVRLVVFYILPINVLIAQIVVLFSNL
jgi:hypothetical protein